MNPGKRQWLVEQLHDKEYRTVYADSVLDSTVAAQIKARGWTQAELAERADMKQSRISTMEDVSYGSWTLSTLKRLARALDLRLVVRFESFGSLFNGIRTRGELDSFDEALLVRPPFEQDVGLLPEQPTAASFTIATKSEELPVPNPPLPLISRAGALDSSV
jgi:transcriptional regulator with XRE-family HTH domain